MQQFTREDILKDNVVNEENLDILCQQINDMSCYDKVGTEFYYIDKSMSHSDLDRSVSTVTAWLNHLSELRVTAKNVGFITMTSEAMIEELTVYYIEEIKKDIILGDVSFLAAVLSGEGFLGYSHLTREQLELEYRAMLEDKVQAND
jgi:hypothetical protein